MKLTIVGCSGSFAGPDSPASCYLVEADGFSVVLDLGSGAVGALARYTDMYDVDAMVLSHLHPDHCIDMCGYYVARKYRPEGPARKIPVYGPADTPSRLASAYGLPADPGMTEEFDFRSLAPQLSFELGPFRATVERTVHPVEAYAIRLEHDGKVLTYSGDSGACEPLVRLAKDSDLFLCEASFLDPHDAPEVHLSGREAAQHATRAGAGRLVITHVPPWHSSDLTMAEAAPHFDGPLDLATPGATFTV